MVAINFVIETRSEDSVHKPPALNKIRNRTEKVYKTKHEKPIK